ncbi:MAG: hypothetical protein JKY36_02490 [Erythrobacter sp.]|nr:hypothetical protein [Erythrobacter sp.]
MTRLLVGTRLLAPGLSVPGEAPSNILARLCEAEDLAALLRNFGEARRQVADTWQSVFDETLELDQ